MNLHHRLQRLETAVPPRPEKSEPFTLAEGEGPTFAALLLECILAERFPEDFPVWLRERLPPKEALLVALRGYTQMPEMDPNTLFERVAKSYVTYLKTVSTDAASWLTGPFPSEQEVAECAAIFQARFPEAANVPRTDDETREEPSPPRPPENLPEPSPPPAPNFVPQAAREMGGLVIGTPRGSRFH